MKTYKRFRFPSDIGSFAAWLNDVFGLSHQDIEDLLVESGIAAFAVWGRAVV